MNIDDMRIMGALTGAKSALEASYDIQSGANSGQKQRAAIAAIDAVLVSRDNDDGWIQHDGGPCPIPDAKAGEYFIWLDEGRKFISSFDARDRQWRNVIRYRLIKPTPSDADEWPPSPEQAVLIEAEETKRSLESVIRNQPDLLCGCAEKIHKAIDRVKSLTESYLAATADNDAQSELLRQAGEALTALVDDYVANVDTTRTAGFYQDPNTENCVIDARAVLAAIDARKP